LTHFRKEGHSENLLTFGQGAPIQITVKELLEVAGVNLDDYAPTDQTTPGEALNGAAGGNVVGGNYPFNRNTVCDTEL